jgi:hypothetical protein
MAAASSDQNGDRQKRGKQLLRNIPADCALTRWKQGAACGAGGPGVIKGDELLLVQNLRFLSLIFGVVDSSGVLGFLEVNKLLAYGWPGAAGFGFGAASQLEVQAPGQKHGGGNRTQNKDGISSHGILGLFWLSQQTSRQLRCTKQ